MNSSPVSLNAIESKIYLIRGRKVMIDSDLAELYAVETKNLNKAVQRNIERFPSDFMFQLNMDPGGHPKSLTCGHLKIPHPAA